MHFWQNHFCLRGKIESLESDCNFWKKRAITREESLEFWCRTARYYRERWNQALEELPVDVAERLLGETWETHWRGGARKKAEKDNG